MVQQDILTEIVRNGNFEKIEPQQYRIMRSFSARALAVKRVTSNKGKRTAGIDGELLKTASSKMLTINKLKSFMKEYKSDPVKRVYIPKPFSNEKRPLGIPLYMIDAFNR